MLLKQPAAGGEFCKAEFVFTGLVLWAKKRSAGTHCGRREEFYSIRKRMKPVKCGILIE